ncbi:hypothetical protein [Amycolatopsis thermophila]|uniref:DUF222 domain-containing protein n=1 Tax=Amycolatopsis thermophila TaxID=206084 RepID=A0ABU0EMP7_9PSEU|nr:hypothetical protein [Amycolatopsis thermophila]MDQ0376542.1 hypothetical protein [Amycolatopsis thermophila]
MTARATVIQSAHPADTLKMIRETLCVAQAALTHGARAAGQRAAEHSARLGRLIDDIDRQRPLGPDGKHGNRHTGTCGCEDVEPPRHNEVTTYDEVRLTGCPGAPFPHYDFTARTEEHVQALYRLYAHALGEGNWTNPQLKRRTVTVIGTPWVDDAPERGD